MLSLISYEIQRYYVPDDGLGYYTDGAHYNLFHHPTCTQFSRVPYPRWIELWNRTHTQHTHKCMSVPRLCAVHPSLLLASSFFYCFVCFTAVWQTPHRLMIVRGSAFRFIRISFIRYFHFIHWNFCVFLPFRLLVFIHVKCRTVISFLLFHSIFFCSCAA